MPPKATWNAGNPAVKRILKEAQELSDHPCREFVAQPTEDNVFNWVFTLRGPDDTEYANGFYRGRIILQSNYPFSPPDCEFLTPNGRFETHKKICLSISSYHPENWHPTWGIKTVLLALREFMATPGNNAIGAIEYPKEKRKQLAVESHTFVCPLTGCAVRDDIELMNRSPASTGFELPAVCKNPPPPPTNPDGVTDGAPVPSAPAATEGSSDGSNSSNTAVPSPAPAAAVSATETAPVAAPVQPPDAQVAPAPAPVPARQPAAPQHQPAIVLEESFINKSIVVVLMAILAILAKKAYQNPDWLLTIF